MSMWADEVDAIDDVRQDVRITVETEVGIDVD